MVARAQALFWAALHRVPTLVVLGLLVALGVWGARNDWKIKWASETEKKEEEEAGQPGVTPVKLGSDEAGEKVGLEVAEARAQLLERTVTAHAVLAFDQNRYAHLASKAQGTVWKVLRQAGERVKEGEVLALVAAPEVGKAKADFLTAYVQTEVRQRTLQYTQAAASSLPERQLRDAQMVLREARARLFTEQQALANYGLPVRTEGLAGLSDEQVARKLRVLGLPAEVVAEKNGKAEDLPANLLPLTAPFDALVVRRDIVVGESVGPTQPQFVLADTSRLWVLLDVRLEDAPLLRLKQEVTFKADATGESAQGILTWISAEVDPKTRTVRARAEVPNPTGALRPATFGTATVTVEASAAALAVPDEAVQFDGQAHRVFVREDVRTYQPRLVLTGIRTGGLTEVCTPEPLVPAVTLGTAPSGALATACAASAAALMLEPVRPGEMVVTTGAHALQSEMLKSRIGGED